MAWLQVKIKNSSKVSKVVGQNMEPRGVDTVWDCCVGFKEY